MKTKMKTLTKLSVIFLLSLTFACNYSDQKEFYISPYGNDNNKGTFEKPFLTLEKARDAIRLIKQEKGLPEGGVTVFLRGGRYFLSQTFILGPDDSGSENAPVRYCAFPGETPVLSGGFIINGWNLLTENLPEIDPVAKGKIWYASVEKNKLFHFLYIDGKMATRSRSINHDNWEEWSHDFTFGKPEKKGQLILLKNKNILKHLPSNGDMEMTAIVKQYGVMGNGVITDIDTTKGTVYWNSSQLNLTPARDWEPKEAYRFENALYLIDEPGEWALNSKLGQVYYYPSDSIGNAGIIAPVLCEIVRFQGDEEAEKWVHHIEFRGITFIYTDRLPENQWPHNWLKRQWENPDAMIFMQGVHDCILEGNRILHSGTYGIALDHYAQNMSITGNEIGFTGSGGIQIYGYGPGTKDVNHHNIIRRNYIHDQGLANYWHSPNIQIFGSGYNTISYNFLARSAYCSISIVGSHFKNMNNYQPENSWNGQVDKWNAHNILWEDFPAEVIDSLKRGEKVFTKENFRKYIYSHNNVVEYNICVEPMQKLYEGGVLYAWCPGKNNEYRGNLIYGKKEMPGSSVIAMDDYSEYALIEDNVVWINGKILDVVGQRDYTLGTTIRNNYNVCLKPEYTSIRKRPSEWWTDRKDIQPFTDLFRKICFVVKEEGGWTGHPSLMDIINEKPRILKTTVKQYKPTIGEDK
ncbi:MAG: right-handed parallel beta-helix repeat-containing protein [Bacteroidetes bacterium]|nr:right-handed parallel beta-helix repeat-containing protein [Bacteroidota bacterium]